MKRLQRRHTVGGIEPQNSPKTAAPANRELPKPLTFEGLGFRV